jgi:hypothetical protein
MPVLDFKEIPQANLVNGMQDTFELFARDFFESLGFEVISGPDRGQDDGRDIIIVERRTGIVGLTEVKWLVSCKHKAHSGQSVQDSDEEDIRDRVESHGAQGFIGFYSTLPSAPLSRKLERLRNYFEVVVFDRERIESRLLENETGRTLAKRYFPISYSIWESEHPRPANLFDQYEPLSCKYCGKDLLLNRDNHGVIVFVRDLSVTHVEKIVAIYWACKGQCDELLEKSYKGYGTAGWEDISDLMIPGKYVQWLMAHLNRLRCNADEYTDEAFSDLKKFLLRVAQIVIRPQSKKQVERLKLLFSLPEWL